MNLAETIRMETCSIDLRAKDKDEALQQIAALYKRSDSFVEIDESTIYAALKAREAMGSTGFVNGIAIPHCQIEGLKKFYISLAICKKGVYFDSIDHKKTHIFVSIIGPTNSRNEHLQYLAACSHILKQPGVTSSLMQATTRINLYEEFLTHADNGSGKIAYKGKDKLLLLIIQDESILQDITEVFIEYGIQQSIILEGAQMENLISKVPLFMGFFNFTGDKNPNTKIILAKIVKDHINAITKGLEDVFGDLDSFSGLKLLVMDVFFAKGF
ncbi:MAG: PTS sugar transporter subunit IIA [Candidatus Cloacimonetes bacterium]|nr:PTS sugar transporter subunit IIA [Candidatus Cloacimonadota bacterium]